LLEQDYDDFEIILIDDASIDKSLQVIPRDPRIRTIVRKQRRGLASNLHDVLLNVCSQDDIVVCVDGDDWLLKSGVLSCIDETYRQAGCWVTFGQFEFSNGDYGFSQPFSSEADFSTLREYFRTSHLRTFRAGLFQRIAEQDPHYSCLKDENGAWLSSAVDAALMCPLLELAGFHRARFVDRVLYHYNNEGPNHVHSLDRQGQIKNFECIRRKPRFSQVEHYLAVMEVQ
jgi:glycosyltransferase involved in cell wall biosynthesis